MAVLDFDRSVAVVIGIDHYGNGIPALRTAVADARAVAELLGEEHDYEVRLLLDVQATKQQLQVLVRETLPGLLTKRSRLLFYFAGHGIAQDGDDGPAGYLIPQDAQVNEAESYLPMRWLHDELTQLPCKHFLAIFDCCFAGAFRWSSTRRISRSGEVIHRERFDRFQQDPAWQVITSASYDQEAWDIFRLSDDRIKVSGEHSPFAMALMQALMGAADTSPPAMNGRPAGDGVITATELYTYLRDQVEVRTAQQRKRQTPELCALKRHDKGEFIFLTPGHELNLPPAPELKVENNPYRGLESFDQSHRKLFFGRDEEIERLLAKVKAMPPLTIVLGASGTGKSSLVKAGLLPRLARQDWEFELLPVMRPGERPLEALARAVAGVRTLSARQVRLLGRKLARDEQLLARLVERWQGQNPGKTLVLVVDQGEELVTQCRDEAEAKQFQRLLTRALEKQGRRFRVLVTLRLDFEAQFQQEEWKSVWMASRFVVPPMTQAQLREAIENPAAERVLYFEPSGLVDRLVEDVGQTPGALPLLSFTLSELYLLYLERRSDNRALTAADYEALGGVTGSLTQRATQEYEALVAEDGAFAQTVKHVMLRMVAVEGGELARRRVPRSELVYGSEVENGRVQRLLNRLIAARLVVKGQDGEEEPYVEPAHDALVRGWDKLLRWKNEEQENLVLQRLLTPASRAWKQTKRNQDLWEKNSRLATLREISFKGSSWLNQLELDFVENSWKIKRRNQRIIQASVVSFIAFATGAIFISNTLRISADNSAKEAIKQEDLALASAAEATNQRNTAEKNAAEAKKQAEIATENAIKAQKQEELAEKNAAEATVQAEIAKKNAAEAKKQTGIAKEEADRANAQTKLAKEQQDLAEQRQKEAEEQNIHALINLHKAFSAANQPLTSMVAGVQAWQKIRKGNMEAEMIAWPAKFALIRSAYYENSFYGPISKNQPSFFSYGPYSSSQKESQDTLEKSSLKGGFLLKNLLKGHTSRILSLAFSPDGTIIVSSGQDSTVRLWNRHGKLIKTIQDHHDSVMSVTFSPDNQSFASASLDGTIRLWNMKGEPIKQLVGPETWTIGVDGSSRAVGGLWFESIDFNSTGKIIVASNSTNRKIYLWNEKGDLINVIDDGGTKILSVKFSPDGKTIASANGEGIISLWSDRGELIRHIKGHNKTIRDIAFSPDGTKIFSAGDDGEIKSFSLQGKLLSSISDDGVGSISFRPDGKFIVSASDDGTIKIWDRQGKIVETLEKLSGGGRAVSFSPDGKTIVSGSESGTIQLWEQSDSPLIELAGLYSPGDTFFGAFSPDLDKVASVKEDGVRLWNWNGELLKILEDEGVKRVGDLAFSPDGKKIAIMKEHLISLWEPEENQIETLNIFGPDTRYVGNNEGKIFFSPGGKYIAASGNSQSIAIWSLREQRASWNQVIGENVRVPYLKAPGLSFSPDGNRVVTSTMDGLFNIWHHSKQKPKVIEGHSKNRYVDNVIFSPDGNFLSSTSEDETIKIWNMKGELLQTLEGHTSEINQVIFSSDSAIITSASDDGIVKFWNLEGELLISLEDPNSSAINKISLKEDNTALATFSKDGIARKWSLDSKPLFDWHCRWLHDYLSNNPDGQKAKEEGACQEKI